MTPNLVIFLKEPWAGRVKTRLGADIGLIESAWWFRWRAHELIRKLDADPRWRLHIGVTPDKVGLQSRVWPAHIPRLAQGRGDLGARMARVLRALPPGPCAIIGADIPGITPAHIASAFCALGDHDAVFGPAFDGGYWLIGLCAGLQGPRQPAGFLQDVRWSSDYALADSINSLPRGARIARIGALQDIDRLTDLQAYAKARSRPSHQ